MHGLPLVPFERLEQLEVVRGILTNAMSLYEGSLRLGMDIDDLAAMVAGARQAVYRTLGEEAVP